MATPFRLETPRRPTLWQRLLRRRPKENAVIEVNNLLAGAAAVRAVRPEEVDRIGARHGLDLRSELGGRAERFYREYLLYCLSDQRLSEEEHADLKHLQRVLRLDALAVQTIHENVARQVYARSVSQVLEDGRIDPAERAFLGQLQQQLELPAGTAQRIEAARATEQGGA